MSSSKDIEAYLAQLARQGVRLWLDAGKLRCSGPKDVLQGHVAQGIREQKDAITAFLDEAQSSSDTHSSDKQTIPVFDHQQAPPLSFAQQRIWFMEQLRPDTGAFNIPFALSILGELKPQALNLALQALSLRHDVLRSRFVLEQDQPCVKVLAPKATHGAELEQITLAPTNDPLAAFKTHAQAASQQAFNLAQQPLLKVQLVEIEGEPSAYLFFVIHHIIADGVSLDVLLKDLGYYYRYAYQYGEAQLDALSLMQQLPPLERQYLDYAAWQRQNLQGDTLQKAMDFWSQELQSPLPNTQINPDFARPAIPTQNGAVVSFSLNKSLSDKLKHVANQEQSTLFSTLFLAFNILLARFSDQDDLIVGTPVSHRANKQLEGIIGLFVNPLPVRTQLDMQQGFRANLQTMQNRLNAIFAHQQLPFEKMVEHLLPERDPALQPFFQIKFQLDHTDQAVLEQRPGIALPGATLHQVAKQETIAKLDLSLDLIAGIDGIACGLEYNTDLYRSASIEALSQHFVCLLEALTSQLDTPLQDISLLTQAQQRQQLEHWNQSQCSFKDTLCYHHLFEQQAKQYPQSPCLIYDEDRPKRVRELSYEQTNQRANQLAHYLIKQGIGAEQLVAICLPRSPEMVIAMLAVMKAGAAYLPLDPSYPSERLSYMLADANVRLLISSADIALELGSKTPWLEVDCINGNWASFADQATHNPDVPLLPENLAYLIYTSGSTGKPKGVQIQHQGLVNLTEDKIRVCDVRPGDTVLQFFSFSFDASVPELVMSLATGARLLISSAECIIPGPVLSRLLKRHRVSHITMTPSALMSLPQDQYPDLRMVLVGGEAPALELIEHWAPGRRFINAYGPTETTVNASMEPCGNGLPTSPYLLPSANKQLLILDNALQLRPVGVPGELHIAGVGLARGYLNRPELTAERFIPNPYANAQLPKAYQTLYKSGDLACYQADGSIRILGRIDQQTKIRGFRIELEEIEHVLSKHQEVKTAIVLVHERQGEKTLIGFYLSQPEATPNSQELKQHLAQSLPGFMVPARLYALEQLPLTPNGKVDNRALLALDADADHSQSSDKPYRAPEGELEIATTALFKEILNCDKRIGCDDNFFDLGGHSLLATRLVARCIALFDVEITLLELFNEPTPAGVAKIIQTARSQHQGTADAAQSEAERDTLLRQALAQDLHLNEAIAPSLAQAARPVEAWQNILLTGATGFIGVYLLAELLKQSQANIYCVVRAQDEDQAQTRLIEAMQAYDLWQEQYRTRIQALVGDLAQAKLGMSEQQWQFLSTHIDAIYHNGAWVHHILPYDKLKASNVDATKDLLALASQERIKPFHYTSTLTVLPPLPLAGRTALLEQDNLADYPVPKGSYNATKWVAEQLVSEAAKRGLPVAIYRPGPVSGDSRSGKFNTLDILSQIMQGYLYSGLAPEGELPMDMMPVDYLARLMVHLSHQAASVGKTFHMIHSNPVSSDLIFDVCHQAGYPIKRVDYASWHQELREIAQNNPNHPLYPLVALFANRKSFSGKDEQPDTPVDPLHLPFDTRNKDAGLAQAPFDEPVLDSALFGRYLQALVREKNIQAASPKPQANERAEYANELS